MWFNDDQNLCPVQHIEKEAKIWGLRENWEKAKPKIDRMWNYSVHWYRKPGFETKKFIKQNSWKSLHIHIFLKMFYC